MSGEKYERVTVTERNRVDLTMRLTVTPQSLQLRIAHGDKFKPENPVYLYEDDLKEIYCLLRPHFEFDYLAEQRFAL